MTHDGAQPTELILIRHGVTAWNRERRFQGQIDTPLSDIGLAQARITADRLAGRSVTALYSSDLRRALQTAEPISAALRLPVRIEPGIRERNYGAFEGRTFDEIQRDLPEAFERWRAREVDFVISEGAETLASFAQRVARAMVEVASRHPGESIALVTHGGVLDCAYRVATGLALDAPRKHAVLNASLNTVVWSGGRFDLAAWADIAHLADHDGDASVAISAGASSG